MRSAQLAYYFFLSIFPLAICLVALVGVFAAESARFRTELFTLASQTGPSSPLLRKTIERITSRNGTGLMSAGIVVALWSASAGMSAIMDALNHQDRVEESRPFVKRAIVALALTIAVGVLLLLAIGTALVGSNVIRAFGGGGILQAIWSVARWIVVLVFGLFGFDLIYRFAPQAHRKWEWFSAGSITALVVWIAASVGFRVYVAYFSRYNATYGSLGTVVVLLVWFYLTGFAILIGSEVNIVAENAAAGRAQLDRAA